MHNAFNNFFNDDLIGFLESNGLKVKLERGGRYFPLSDKAKDVSDLLVNKINELKIDLRLSCAVNGIVLQDNVVKGVDCVQGWKFFADFNSHRWFKLS